MIPFCLSGPYISCTPSPESRNTWKIKFIPFQSVLTCHTAIKFKVMAKTKHIYSTNHVCRIVCIPLYNKVHQLLIESKQGNVYFLTFLSKTTFINIWSFWWDNPQSDMLTYASCYDTDSGYWTENHNNDSNLYTSRMINANQYHRIFASSCFLILTL